MGEDMLDPIRHRTPPQPIATTWDPESDDLTTGTNAHRTNTLEELKRELHTGANWLEGDLRVDERGTLVMAHDADQESAGLTLEQWLQAGRASEHGMKVDVKEREAIPGLLDALERSGIPDGRLMINVGELPVDQLHEIRQRFPDAWLALNPMIEEDGYHLQDLQRTSKLADAVGGRIVFPIRWDAATDEAIAALTPHGKVSIWTARSQGTPDDTEAETRRLRARGVDGVIDLGPPLSFAERIMKHAFAVWQSDPVRGARNLVDAGLDAAREGAARLPVIGGWFDLRAAR